MIPGKKNRIDSGFTLVEVMVAALLVAVIGGSSFMTMSVVTQGTETASTRMMARQLLQKSLEEVRHYAFSDPANFNSLNRCKFPPSAPSCGFAPIGTSYPPDFSRTLAVSDQSGINTLKQVTATVQWREFDRIQTLQSTVLLSRPPDPLPGNIVGLVQGADHNPIPAAMITVTKGAQTSTAGSKGNVDARGFNFTFADNNGNFMLPAGQWALRATKAGYQPYVHPQPVTVFSNMETPVTIRLEQLPLPAQILVRLNSAGSLILSFWRGQTYLWEKGVYKANTSNANQSTFNITFSDLNPRCFTVNTYGAYYAGYAFKFAAPCDGLNYDPQGWSSAKYAEDGTTISCANNYNGGAGLDTICVGPGETRTLDINLNAVPQGTVRGTVFDAEGKAIEGATLNVVWPNGSGYSLSPAQTTDSSGEYLVAIPAAQEMFSDVVPNYMQIRATMSVDRYTCCGQKTTITRTSAWRRVGPLYDGTDLSGQDMVIDLTPVTDTCGNVGGRISDAASAASPLVGVDVRISGTERTNILGDYVFQCPPTQSGYRVLTGSNNVEVSGANIYPFRNYDGNSAWYVSRNGVVVQTDDTVPYDLLLSSLGRGTIQVVVVEKGTTNVIQDVDVQLSTYDGVTVSAFPDKKVVSDVNHDGTIQFAGIVENWPPRELPIAAGGFKRSPIRHKINVTDRSGGYQNKDVYVTDLGRGDVKVVTIELEKKSGI